MKMTNRFTAGLVATCLAVLLGACGSPKATTTEPASEEESQLVADDTVDESEQAEDEAAPESSEEEVQAPAEVVQPVAYSEGDSVQLTGYLRHEAYDYKGSAVDCLILELDEPIDGNYGTYPNENDPVWHEGVTSVDVSDLLVTSSLDSLDVDAHCTVSGTFWGSSKQSGAHYDESGVFQINGGCSLRDAEIVL